MTLNKWACAAICVAMGSLQAWDSGVLEAERTIQVVVAIAMLLPAAAVVVTESYGVRAMAVAAAFLLLTVARMTASMPLPTLHIIAFIPAVLIFFSQVAASRPETRAGGVKG